MSANHAVMAVKRAHQAQVRAVYRVNLGHFFQALNVFQIFNALQELIQIQPQISVNPVMKLVQLVLRMNHPAA